MDLSPSLPISARLRLVVPIRRWVLAFAAGFLCACGGGGSSPSDPGNPVPAPQPPTAVGDIRLEVISSTPPPGSALTRGAAQRFVTRFRFSSGSSTARPLFLVGHLRQFQGGDLVDDPFDFHFHPNPPSRDGEIEATIDRTVINASGSCRIVWTLAMENPDGTTFAGASLEHVYTIP